MRQEVNSTPRSGVKYSSYTLVLRNVPKSDLRPHTYPDLRNRNGGLCARGVGGL